MLEPNDVAQLINPIGDQLRFKANLEVWKKEMVVAGQNRNVTADVNETPLDSSFMGRLLRDLDNPSENCSPSTSIQRDSSCLAPESDNIENEVILILQKTLEGRAILAKGQHNNGLLNLELRKELANLIIRDKLQADPNKLLSGPSLLKISHQIATIFPQESPVHFYAPYLRATEFQTKRNTSGILYNAYSTRKRHLRSLGALPASKRSTSRRQSTNSDTKRTIPSGIIFEEHSTVEVAELLKNLEHPDPGPWQTIEQTWTSTLSARIHFLYQEKGTLADYLNRFPILKSPSGYHLLLQDFQKLYPEKCDGMTVFSNSTKRIIELAISKVKQTKDIYLKRTIEDYIGSIDANKEESELNVSLLLLPFIINISPVRRKDSWKASRSEVRDGFITHVPTDREILVALAERREKLAKEKSTSIAYYLTRCPLIRIIMLVRLSELANFNVFHIKTLSPLPKHINHNEKLHFICDN
ncbi:hypothetical protein EVAR_90851_1 [Eumeta japonica]|uniref:Uncharacterized protein n=2 Tax=Eumeta variegata TaxID=151549 RepID=A0A4C1ZSB2_EUMVA|nr:hypothetical protein EVAR_90851_1 [Eumeta japonica]